MHGWKRSLVRVLFFPALLLAGAIALCTTHLAVTQGLGLDGFAAHSLALLVLGGLSVREIDRRQIFQLRAENTYQLRLLERRRVRLAVLEEGRSGVRPRDEVLDDDASRSALRELAARGGNKRWPEGGAA